MKHNSVPTSSGDEVNDPLLITLRQRLGSYSQAPPPGTWAAIRQQLPPRRRRRLVPLFGLLLGLVVGGALLRWHVERSAPAARRAAYCAPVAQPAAQPASEVTLSGQPTKAASQALEMARPMVTTPAPYPAPAAPLLLATAPLFQEAAHRQSRSLPGAIGSKEHRPLTASIAYASTLAQKINATSNSRRQAAKVAARHRPQSARQHTGIYSELAFNSPDRLARLPTATTRTPATWSATSSSFSLATGEGAGLIEVLLPRQATLDLLLPAAPILRPIQPNSVATVLPAEARERRWSLLVVAGPTLSYRNLSNNEVIQQHLYANLSTIERPALGLGVQGQVRRVLSDRWALAVGLGYHQYATQLAIDSANGSYFHRRDTYNLLTLPIQLSYALGAPHDRLAFALLAGAEPGWYLGGRSASDFSIRQQVYSLSGNNPYHPWSVAVSMGLDLRYRLGKPDSRWHLLMQPTGRYVVTPFVRANIPDFYTQRRPFSLGLFVGFSWDWR